MDNVAGERIRKCRENLKMSQSELARKLGYKSRTSVNKAENSREISYKIALKYAKVLNVPAEYILGVDNEYAREEEYGHLLGVLISNHEKEEIIFKTIRLMMSMTTEEKEKMYECACNIKRHHLV